MAVVFEGKGGYGSGTSSASCSMPASVAEGDLLILIAEAGGAIPSIPSGWTNIGSGQTGGPSEYARTRVCYKIAGASESAVSVSGGNEGVRGIVLRFTGHDPTTPIAYTNGGADSGNLSANTFTTTVANVMVVCALGFYDADADDTSNWGSWACASLESITEGHDQSDTAGYGGGVAFAYGVKASAGAVGSVTATADASGIIYYVTFGIAPLSAQTLTLSGIASGAAIGTPTMVKGNVNVALSGIASALAIGTATVVPGNATLILTGIAPTVQIGTATITSTGPTLNLNGIASTVQIGTPTMVPGNRTLQLPGIPSGAALGTITVVPGEVILTLAGIASAVAIGTPTLLRSFVPLQITLALLEMPLTLIQSEDASDGTESSGVILLAVTENRPTVAIIETGRVVSLSEMPLTLEQEVLDTELEVT